MSRSFLLTDELAAYVARTFPLENDILRRLRDETAAMPNSAMQIGADQGQFMSILIRAIGARRCLEVGVFTGYSSLVTALALPSDGKLVACDVSEEFTSVARRYWHEAGVASKIELKLGPALDTLDSLLSEGQVFDFCFIDADKPNYCGYYERAVQLVRPNGLIAIDNTLWSGKVADPGVVDEGTVAIRQLNEMVAGDDRVESCLLPIGDGVTLARKK